MIETTNPALATIFTVGHSNRSLDRLIDLLHSHKIRQLIDVRSKPNSRHFPAFNRNSMSPALEEEGIAYAWLGHELGGIRRGKPDSPHAALATDGFRGYADHMSSATFQKGILQLTGVARHTNTAIMCAEREPSQCHRSLIADYLLLRQWQVIHLLDLNISQPHKLSALARHQDQGLIYDQLGQKQLDMGF